MLPALPFWQNVAVCFFREIALSQRKMFVLAEMKDTVKVPPRLFHIKLNSAVAETLNKKLANKVCYFLLFSDKQLLSTKKYQNL